MDITYWNKDIETMDRSAIEALQLKRLRELVDQSLKTEFYKRRLSKAGICLLKKPFQRDEIALAIEEALGRGSKLGA